jgi:hypothetical protein
MKQSSSWEATARQKFPAFYGTRRFIAVFTKPATGSHSGPDEYNPHFKTQFSWDTDKIILLQTQTITINFQFLIVSTNRK